MKIDGPFYSQLGDAVAETRRLEEIGYDGVYTLEGNSDPFLPLVMVAEHSKKLDIATGIAVALPRNPAHLAYQAWDLHKYSQGRFLLGLGSQVKAHIEKRFSCDFDRPAARMREHILAIKAFFDCWQDVSSPHADDADVQCRAQSLRQAADFAGRTWRGNDRGCG